MKERIKVIFRVLEGEVIALFPAVPGSMDPSGCLSYMHRGQHGEAEPLALMSQRCRLATPREYRELAKELRRIGYILEIRKRSSRADYLARKEQCKA